MLRFILSSTKKREQKHVQVHVDRVFSLRAFSHPTCIHILNFPDVFPINVPCDFLYLIRTPIKTILFAVSGYRLPKKKYSAPLPPPPKYIWHQCFQFFFLLLKPIINIKCSIKVFLLLCLKDNKINCLHVDVQYSQRHSVITHCDRNTTHLGDLDISFVLLSITSKFLLHLECYLSFNTITQKAYQNSK